MSINKLIESARTHPEIIAIALEVTMDPGRRRHYSPLVLMLADAAMQEIMSKITKGASILPSPDPDS
jgi:hypothetical protein